LRRADELVLNGFPLGLFPGTSLDGFERRSIAMDPGDVLLLGTDGLTNAEDAEGKMFGEGPMHALLGTLAGRGGDEVIRSLLEAGKQFTGGDGWSDDVNLVAITQRPVPPTGL
jgi:sigma-B regulation protein RsbU (phosphoserine phosphatase)